MAAKCGINVHSVFDNYFQLPASAYVKPGTRVRVFDEKFDIFISFTITANTIKNAVLNTVFHFSQTTAATFSCLGTPVVL